jgi:hypothetical protein
MSISTGIIALWFLKFSKANDFKTSKVLSPLIRMIFFTEGASPLDTATIVSFMLYFVFADSIFFLIVMVLTVPVD